MCNLTQLLNYALVRTRKLAKATSIRPFSIAARPANVSRQKWIFVQAHNNRGLCMLDNCSSSFMRPLLHKHALWQCHLSMQCLAAAALESPFKAWTKLPAWQLCP